MASDFYKKSKIDSAKLYGENGYGPPTSDPNLNYVDNLEVSNAYWQARGSKPYEPPLTVKGHSHIPVIRKIAFILGITLVPIWIVLVLCTWLETSSVLCWLISIVMLVLIVILLRYANISEEESPKGSK